MPQKTLGEPVPGAVDFVDLGFTDAVRLKELAGRAGHSDRVLVGIERPTLPDKPSAVPPNLELRYGGILDELGRMPDGSVKVVNADFLFGEIYEVAGGSDVSERFLRAAQVGANKANPLYHTRQRIMGEVGRVLAPNGRFYLTEYGKNLPLTLKLLEEGGFRHTERELLALEMGGSTQLMKVRDLLREKPEEAADRAPYRIVARKAKEETGWLAALSGRLIDGVRELLGARKHQ
jgi:hypothetical protein